MKIVYTEQYKKDLKKLPKGEKKILYRKEKILEKNINDPRLHLKRLKGFKSKDVFSFRISIRYRGLIVATKEKIILFAIGHRKDIYR